MLLLADHNSLAVKGKDAYRSPEFEHHCAMVARDLETQVLSEQGLLDLWCEVQDAAFFEDFSMDHELRTSRRFTFGFSPDGKAVEPSQLRRIDRIHVSSFLVKSVSKCYPRFVARSDHKAVVASMEPPCASSEGVTRHFYCPTTFLQDEDAVCQMRALYVNSPRKNRY